MIMADNERKDVRHLRTNYARILPLLRPAHMSNNCRRRGAQLDIGSEGYNRVRIHRGYSETRHAVKVNTVGLHQDRPV